MNYTYDEPIVTGDRKFTSELVFSMIFAIALACLDIVLVKSAFSGKYPDLFMLLISLLFFGFIGGLIINCFLFFNIAVYQDRMVMTYVLSRKKKTLYKDEITAWTEYEITRSKKTHRKLTLYAGSRAFSFNSYRFGNYNELKDQLIANKLHDEELERTQRRKNSLKGVYFLFIYASALAIVSFCVHLAGDRPGKDVSFSQVHGVITNKAEVHHGSKGARWIVIYLQEQPDFKFRIEGGAFRAMNVTAYLETVQIGDTLDLDIKTDVYRKKITHKVPLSFWDKTINYDRIHVYGIRDGNQVFLSSAGYDKFTESNEVAMLITAGMSFFLIIIAVLAYRKVMKQ